MRIAIIGYSGSGKSTLAVSLGTVFQAEVLHFDRVQFLPGWEIRAQEDKERIVKEFLDSHDSWVIDGNYSKLFLSAAWRRRISLSWFFSIDFHAYGVSSADISNIKTGRGRIWARDVTKSWTGNLSDGFCMTKGQRGQKSAMFRYTRNIKKRSSL